MAAKDNRNGRGLFVGAILGAVIGFLLGKAAGNPVFGAFLGAVIVGALMYRVNPGRGPRR